jgi:hypothetical protein
MQRSFNITFNYVSKNCPFSVINKLTVVFVADCHARVLTTRVYSEYPSKAIVGKSGALNIINFVRVPNTHRHYTEVPVSYRAQGCTAFLENKENKTELYIGISIFKHSHSLLYFNLVVCILSQGNRA